MTIQSRAISVSSTPLVRLRDGAGAFLGVGGRLLAAIRTWAAASQLGPMAEKEIGRRTGART